MFYFHSGNDKYVGDGKAGEFEERSFGISKVERRQLRDAQRGRCHQVKKCFIWGRTLNSCQPKKVFNCY